MFNSQNPFSKLVQEEQQRQNEQLAFTHSSQSPPKSPAATLADPSAESSHSKPTTNPPPLPDRPRSPPQPPRPETTSAASTSTGLDQRFEDIEPPPYEEVVSDRILEQGPRRPFTTAPGQSAQPAQPAQHSQSSSYHNNSPATPVHTRPTGYPGQSGMQHSYSQPSNHPYSYRPSYSQYPNRTGGAPISGIIRSGRPPPPGAIVFQAGDPRIGGTFCYKCDGTGKRTDWLFGITETCYKCGGIGRRFH